MTVTCRPVTASNLDDLLAVFGEQGASCGCWCMFWRISGEAFASNGNDGNRAAMLDRIQRGEVPGLLAYVDGVPAGWCSVAPRESFREMPGALAGEGVWSVTCFFVSRAMRRMGVAEALVRGAVEHVRASGGRVVEAYPSPVADAAAYMGTTSMFAEVGFEPTEGVYRLGLSKMESACQNGTHG